MLYINEWFPNPVGNDNKGEFIELYNSGPRPVSLTGYQLSDGARKKFSLSGYSVPAEGYLSLDHAQTKLSLKNTSGSLWLYGPSGQVVDSAIFRGIAPEGKSFSRVDYSSMTMGHFTFLYPTSGEQNRAYDNSVTNIKYPIGVPLARGLSPLSCLSLAVSVSLFFLLFFIYVIQHNRNISYFFFGGDSETRPRGR